MTASEERLFVLHQFVALRRAGSSALEAVERMVEALPEGDTRLRCREAAQRLRAPDPTVEGDLFVRVLSDRSGLVSRAEVLAQALDAQLELEGNRRAFALMMILSAGVPLVLVSAIGWLDVSFLPEVLPPATVALQSIASVLRWVGIPFVVAASVALWRWRTMPLPGSARLRGAVGCLVAASAAEAARPLNVLWLEPVARAFLDALSRTRPLPDALVLVGQRLLQEGRRELAVSRALVGVGASIAMLVTVSAIWIAVSLPIFSIAGAIR